MHSILFVDDDPSNLSTFRRSFRRYFTVTTAQGGQEALEELRRGSFHALLTDFTMPGMNGLDLLQQVQLLYPAMVRLVVSGHFDVAVLQNARDQGVVAEILPKPWDTKELAAMVQRLVDGGSAGSPA